MKKFFILPLVSAFFTLSACAPEPASVPEQEAVPSTESLNQEQQRRYEEALKPLYMHWYDVDEQHRRFDIDCEDCPASVGQLVSFTLDNTADRPRVLSGNCFGGLIGPNRFLTNRHCLPEDIRSAGASCEDRVQIVFPRLNGEHAITVVGCEQIELLSPSHDGVPEEQSQPDWAILQLAESLPERVTEAHPGPLPNQTPYRLFVPLEGHETGRIQVHSINCTTRQNTLGVPEYNGDISPLVFFECDRDLTKGYSGSPVFQNRDGVWQPVAVFSHIYDRQINAENIIVSRMGVATPLVCTPMFGGEALEECTFNPVSREALKEQLIVDALNEARPQIHERVLQVLNADHPIRWEAVSVEQVEAGNATPTMEQVWQQMLALESPLFQRPSKQAFFETMVQLRPVCLKPEAIPNHANGDRTLTEVPLIHLQVRDHETREVRVHWRMTTLEVEVYSDINNLQNYVLSLHSRVPPNRPHPRALFSSRFNHAALSIPVCAENETESPETE